MNADMTLDGFKKIFWWEWAHRLLARVLGAAFIIPGLWFWLRGKLQGRVRQAHRRGDDAAGVEPIVGWWMVSSGLSQRTEVEQERLAIHLLIAAATFAALIHAAVGAGAARREKFREGFIGAAWGLVALLFVQLGLGALAAGLRAGRIYNDWPLMGGGSSPRRRFT